MNRKRSWLIGLAILLAVVILAWAGFLGWHTYKLVDALKTANSLIADLNNGDIPLEKAVKVATDAQSHLQALQAGLTPVMPLFNLLGGVPAQAEPILKYSIDLTNGANLALQALQPAWAILQEGAPNSTPKVVEQINLNRAKFTAAGKALESASTTRLKILPALLPDSISSKITALDRYLPSAITALKLAAILPDIVGYSKESTYLVASENSDELRATGGFISAVGILRLDKGEIQHIDLTDSYNVDNPAAQYPKPPFPLQQYWNAAIWVIRDANWSPDFPTTARQIENLYQISVDKNVDGVFVFDQIAVKMMLHAMGPVTISQSGDVITDQNIISWIYDSWSPKPGTKTNKFWYTNRKAFMPLLAKAMIDQLYKSHDPKKMKDILLGFFNTVQQGHVQLNFQNKDMQNILAEAHLDGSVQPDQSDYLFLVDTNIGFNKTDAVVKRKITYQVDLSDLAALTAKMTATYTHPVKQDIKCVHDAYYGETYQDMFNRCYWDYWRVLTAPGAKLLGSEVIPVPDQLILSKKGWDGTVETNGGEGNTTQFSGLFVLPTNQQTQWSLTWQIPEHVIQRQNNQVIYTLNVVKQAGLTSLPLNISVKAPTGMSLNLVPEGWKQDAQPGVWLWQGNITQAIHFQLVFSP